jgi:hypothetical protein
MAKAKRKRNKGQPWAEASRKRAGSDKASIMSLIMSLPDSFFDEVLAEVINEPQPPWVTAL